MPGVISQLIILLMRSDLSYDDSFAVFCKLFEVKRIALVCYSKRGSVRICHNIVGIHTFTFLRTAAIPGAQL